MVLKTPKSFTAIPKPKNPNLRSHQRYRRSHSWEAINGTGDRVATHQRYLWHYHLAAAASCVGLWLVWILDFDFAMDFDFDFGWILLWILLNGDGWCDWDQREIEKVERNREIEIREWEIFLYSFILF